MTEPARRIPVCVPHLAGNEERYVAEAVRTGWISSAGPSVGEFERKFSSYCGAAHGVAAANGTAALHLALKAIGVGPGDEVVLPDFTMVAVLFSVLYCGATPVVVDAEPDTWNVDAARLRDAVTPRTRAIVAVHTYGHPCDMDAIAAVAAEHGIAVVEDAAEAHGAEYRGRRTGGLGRIAAFSFFANKIITTGEGGMVVTSDPALADRARYFQNLCFPLGRGREYRHDDVGYNYRLTNVQAALGLAQLERIDELVERRRANARRYAEELADVPGVTLPVERDWARNVYWMYGIVIDADRFGRGRDDLAAGLAKRGVETRTFFQPMHAQRPFAEAAGRAAGSFAVCERLARDGLYLPSGSGLTDEEIRYVCRSIREVGRG
jgi:perosamine synthetase